MKKKENKVCVMNYDSHGWAQTSQGQNMASMIITFYDYIPILIMYS